MSPSSRRDFLRHSAAAVSATGVCGYTDLFASVSVGRAIGRGARRQCVVRRQPVQPPGGLLHGDARSGPMVPGATPENVLPVLRELKPGCIIIYAKGHSGTTTFPSSLKTEHPMLARDMPAAFRDYTRQTGTRLFLYYSGMLDGAAGERHPDWRMLNKDGSPMRHFADFESFVAWGNCPLSGYFDEWVAVHLREMLTSLRARRDLGGRRLVRSLLLPALRGAVPKGHRPPGPHARLQRDRRRPGKPGCAPRRRSRTSGGPGSAASSNRSSPTACTARETCLRDGSFWRRSIGAAAIGSARTTTGCT